MARARAGFLSSVLIVLAGVSTAPAGAAGPPAALAGLEPVVNQAFGSATSRKSTTVRCPAGKRVTGAGAEITGSDGQVLLDDVIPDPGLTSVTVTAHEDESGQGDWTLGAHALCASTPPGLVRVSVTSPTSSSAKAVSAPCPSGKRVLGAGGEANTFSRHVGLDDIRPSADLTSVAVAAMEDETGTSTPWSVTAFAICADPAFGLERAAGTSALSSVFKTASTVCPGGKGVTGLGGDVNSFNGQVVLNAIFPSGGFGGGQGSTVEALEDPTGNPANWSLTAYAVCASRLDLQIVSARSAEDSKAKGVIVSCPAGKRVTGAGGQIFGGEGYTGGDLLLDDVRPDVGLTSVRVEGREGETGETGAWSVSAYAVCAFPPPGLERVAVSSPLSSADKTVTASCPVGKRVLGVGGDLNTLNGQVLLDDLRPNADLQSVSVNALEDDTGNSASWGATAYAICSDPLAGLERIAVTSPLDSAGKTAFAACSQGKHLTGVGGDVNSFNGQVSLSLFPFSPPSRPEPSVTVVRGAEDQTGNPAVWSLTAYAICVSP